MRIRLNRIRIGWLIIVAAAATLGIVISLLVLGSPERDLAVSAYSDLIRFQADGVATLQVRIFDLSGKVVWDSSVVSGDTIDWNRNNDFGERLAYGAYIYSAQGWNAQGDLIFQKNGKLALMPGDKVQLQAAPAVSSISQIHQIRKEEESPLAPLAFNEPGNFTVGGNLGIGTDVPTYSLDLIKILSGTGIEFAGRISPTFNPSGSANTLASLAISSNVSSSNSQNITQLFGGVLNVEHFGTGAVGSATGFQGKVNNRSVGSIRTARGLFAVVQNVESGTITNGFGLYVQRPLNLGGGVFQNFYGVYIENPTAATNNWAVYVAGGKSYFGGNIGIGTSNTTAKLTVEDSSGQDLIAVYNSSNRVFVVKNTGEVRADGAYYSGAGGCGTGGFIAGGGADVAERINTSEWVEAGNVVEIDPEHPGFFRKASSPYSTKVAGIISTSPGVILGNDFDAAADDWEDSRPVLAVTGRVPCKVTAENGAIEIGDLLVASSTPGVAMKGNPEKAMGAVVGKAMEPLKEREGTIVAQVMLR